jgi:hypothetical protein
MISEDGTQKITLERKSKTRLRKIPSISSSSGMIDTIKRLLQKE